MLNSYWSTRALELRNEKKNMIGVSPSFIVLYTSKRPNRDFIINISKYYCGKEHKEIVVSHSKLHYTNNKQLKKNEKFNG